MRCCAQLEDQGKESEGDCAQLGSHVNAITSSHRRCLCFAWGVGRDCESAVRAQRQARPRGFVQPLRFCCHGVPLNTHGALLFIDQSACPPPLSPLPMHVPHISPPLLFLSH
ncbi:unnamed protein product, partial [Ectocarpus sp. 4 AP-2014]